MAVVEDEMKKGDAGEQMTVNSPRRDSRGLNFHGQKLLLRPPALIRNTNPHSVPL